MKNIHEEMKECFNKCFKTVIIDDEIDNTILSSEEDEEEYDIKKILERFIHSDNQLDQMNQQQQI